MGSQNTVSVPKTLWSRGLRLLCILSPLNSQEDAQPPLFVPPVCTHGILGWQQPGSHPSDSTVRVGPPSLFGGHDHHRLKINLTIRANIRVLISLRVIWVPEAGSSPTDVFWGVECVGFLSPQQRDRRDSCSAVTICPTCDVGVPAGRGCLLVPKWGQAT